MSSDARSAVADDKVVSDLAVEEQEQIFGKDPWSYGLTPANRKNLETVQRYTHQQGMISRTLPLDALFADTDLGDAGGPDGI